MSQQRSELDIRAAGARWLALLLLAGALGCDRDAGPAGPTPLPCTYSLSNAGQSFSSDASTGSVSILTDNQCAWTVEGAGGWLTLASPAAGTGPAAVSFAVSENTGADARTRALTIAGLPFTVAQQGREPCTFAVTPQAVSFDDAGGTGRIDVTTGSGCAWTASSADSWVVITAGARGQGSGTVQYRVAEHDGEAVRTGSLTVAGRTITVTQEGERPPPAPLDCEYSVAPTDFVLHWHGPGGNATVTTGTGCTWTATPGAAWLVLRSGASGAGRGTIRFEVGTFTEDATRRAAVAVRWPTPTAGQNVWVEQEGCRYGLAAPGATAPVAGGPGEVFVVSQAVTSACGLPCPWTTESQASWILITSSPTKSGDDVVRYVVAGNATGVGRVGTIRIQEMTYTITQAGQ